MNEHGKEPAAIALSDRKQEPRSNPPWTELHLLVYLHVRRLFGMSACCCLTFSPMSSIRLIGLIGWLFGSIEFD